MILVSAYNLGMYEKLTEEQVAEVCRRYAAGEDTSALAKVYDVTPSAIRKRLKSRGVARRRQDQRPDHTLPPEKKLDIYRLHLGGMTAREVGAEVGVVNSTVSNVLRRDFGFARRSSTKRKLLTSDQRAEVARRYQAGENYVELRAAFGDVSPSVIQDALKEHGVAPRVGWSKYRTVRWKDRRGRQFIFKSTWEKAYAEFLDGQGVDWEYETQSYPLNVCRRYTPDFVILENGRVVKAIEVHGWLDRRTKDRIKEFARCYPDVNYELLGPGELSELGLIEESWASHPQAKRVTRFRQQLQGGVQGD